MLESKRRLAYRYQDFFENVGINFIHEPDSCKSNYWLNAIILNDHDEKENFLRFSNDKGVMTRPLWKLLPTLPMYEHCQVDDLKNAGWLQKRIVNIPSSVT